MKKLVLGIAVVIILDVAFISMMNHDAKIREVARTVIPNAVEPVIPFKPPLDRDLVHDNNIEVDEHARVPSARGELPVSDADYTPESSTARKAKTAEVRTPTLDGRQLFPAKIIYYGKYEAPEGSEPSMEISPVRASGTTEARISEPPHEPKKRSFGSRAFGVIKKPFNVVKKPFKWIGSVASDIVH